MKNKLVQVVAVFSLVAVVVYSQPGHGSGPEQVVSVRPSADSDESWAPAALPTPPNSNKFALNGESATGVATT